MNRTQNRNNFRSEFYEPEHEFEKKILLSPGWANPDLGLRWKYFSLLSSSSSSSSAYFFFSQLSTPPALTIPPISPNASACIVAVTALASTPLAPPTPPSPRSSPPPTIPDQIEVNQGGENRTHAVPEVDQVQETLVPLRKRDGGRGQVELLVVVQVKRLLLVREWACCSTWMVAGNISIPTTWRRRRKKEKLLLVTSFSLFFSFLNIF